jgi:hypothetical protein
MSRRPPSSSLKELGPVIRRRSAPRRRGRRGPALILLILFLLGGAAAGTAAVKLHHGGGPNLAQERAPARQVVVFLVDGIRPEALTKSAMPRTAALTRQGTIYRNAWTGQMENVPLASAATLGTGAFPRTNGVIGSEWRDASGHIQAPENPQQAVLGGLDQTMQSAGAVPLAAAIKDRQPRARILAVGGDNCAEGNAAASWLADYVLCFSQDGRRWAATAVAGHTLPSGMLDSGGFGASVSRSKGAGTVPSGWKLGEETDQVKRYALAAMTAVHPTLTIINLTEYAQVVPHASVDRRAAVSSRLLHTIDRAVAAIVTWVRKQPGGDMSAFVIASGEAVSDVQQSISQTTIENAIISAGGEQVYLDGGGTAAIGLQDPLQAQPVARAIESERLPNVDAIYFKAQIRNGWTYRPQFLDPLLSPAFAAAASSLLATLASPIAPDVLLVCAPGTAVKEAQPDVGIQGAGGPSIQWDTQHTLLALFGHGTARGASQYPARIVDVAPTVAALLGLTMQQPDGVVLADGLAFPSDQAKSSQDNLAAGVTRTARALQQRSTALS